MMLNKNIYVDLLVKTITEYIRNKIETYADVDSGDHINVSLCVNYISFFFLRKFIDKNCIELFVS